ncbi:MAG: hypothetical protein AAF799_45760 [Myxococcota bacterium]
MILAAALMGPVACGGAESGDSGAADGDDSTSTGVTPPSDESSGEGSSGTQAGPPISLTLAGSWELDPAESDPFPDERPDWVQCEVGWDEEIGAFEVDTELCAYGAFVQRSQVPIFEGDELEIIVLHDALWAEEPAEAHLALVFGDQLVWETRLQIPSEPAQIRESWTATADVPPATDVHWHVHNHGTNNYRLIDLTVSAR